MTIEIRVPGDDDVDALFHADARAFGFHYTPERMAESLMVIDLSRYRIALDGDEVVGVIGSYALDVSLPGGATVPMGAVTWVGVAATHRRQGLLRRLIDACHDDIDARGEPVALLFASEAGIYERFGYGVATRLWSVEIDLRAADLRPELVPAPGSVRFVRGDEASDHVAALWERYRRTRPCETSRPDNWLAFYALIRGQERFGASPAWFLAHADGYAVYRMRNHWNEGRPAHELELAELVALTAEARLALWHVLLNVDLVGTITTRQLPVDDPLPYLLTNPRAVRTTALDDGVWAAVRDVPTCFAARHYAAEDRLVVEVDGVRYSIDGGRDGASVGRVRSRPDLVATPDAMGALLLGGASPTRLANGGRLTPRNDEALRRAEHFFPWPVAPLSQTFY
jgi:predicted acetyltransferase